MRRRDKAGANKGTMPSGEQTERGIIWGRRFAEIMADAGVIVPDSQDKHSIHIYGNLPAGSDLLIGVDVATDYMVAMNSEGKILKQGFYPFDDNASPAGPGAEAKD